MKEQDKTSGRNLSEMEISKLPDKAFRVMVINMLAELRRINEYNENFNREIENIRKYQTEVKELKNSVNTLVYNHTSS